MPRLHINQQSDPNGQHRVEVMLEGVKDQARMTASSTFLLALTEDDQEGLRW